MVDVAYRMATPAPAAHGAPRAHPSWSPYAPMKNLLLFLVFNRCAFLLRCTVYLVAINCCTSLSNYTLRAGTTTTAGAQG